MLTYPLKTALALIVALAATSALVGHADAGAIPQVIFNSLGDTPVIHPEGITQFAGGSEAASFTTPGYAGDVQSLTLDLNCSGQNEPAKCASAPYTSAATAVTAPQPNGNVLTVASTAGITVGSFIRGGAVGNNYIAPGTVYVTAVNSVTKQITLSSNVTFDTGGPTGRAGVQFSAQGSFTVGLYANTTTGIPGGAATSTSIPTGTALSSFTVYDAALYAQNNGIITANPSYVPYTFTLPFDGLRLNPNSSYWIELTNGSALDPTNTNVGWEFLTDTGQPGNVGVTDEYWYVKNYKCSGNPCSEIDGGSGDTVSKGVFGMEVTYVPEPGTLPALVGAALLGFGLMRRRRSA